MMKPIATSRRTAVLFITAWLAGMPLAAHAQDWKPNKPVEIIVSCSPGCGPDSVARLMQRVLQSKRQVESPVSVQNKYGGAGSVVRTYLRQFEGNGHYLYHGDRAVLDAHAMGRGAYTDLTPIAILFGEHIGVAVKADSPIRSGRDLIERLKKNPAAHSVGLSSIGSVQHQAAAVPLKSAGVDIRKMRNVAFGSGALARTALLGGHVDFVPATLGSLEPDVRTGALRVIAVASAERQPGLFANAATWREQGANAEVFLWRGMFGTKGMTAPQVAYWEAIFHRLTRTPEWQAEMDKRSSVTQFVAAAPMKKRMEDEYPAVRALLVDLELAKR
jgi:putative tricarboxylic transport membrane protein